SRTGGETTKPRAPRRANGDERHPVHDELVPAARRPGVSGKPGRPRLRGRLEDGVAAAHRRLPEGPRRAGTRGRAAGAAPGGHFPAPPPWRGAAPGRIPGRLPRPRRADPDSLPAAPP